jgi:hypothetical protein
MTTTADILELWAASEDATIRLHAHRMRAITVGDWPPPTPPPNPPPVWPEPELDQWLFITTDRLIRDTCLLGSRLPNDIDGIVGIARSGLLPGSILATMLHLPLWSCTKTSGLQWLGTGIRTDGRFDQAPPPRKVAVVDDVVASGSEMLAITRIVGDRWPGTALLKLPIYCHPNTRSQVDMCAARLSGWYFLEWNWANANHAATCGYDCDGILCRDDDPTRPLFLPRRKPVPLICSGRHEIHRAATVAWLARWNVRYDRLVLRDFGELDVYDAELIASMKAREYAASGCGLFAESDTWQAQRINEITGKPVLCPAAGRVFPPRQVPISLPNCPHARANQTGEGCLPIRCMDHRGSSCGGSHSDATHCARCLQAGNSSADVADGRR